MAKVETHYDILRVAPHAPISVIKAAYKSLCQTYHPDKFSGNTAEGNKLFKAIQQSYAVLSDPHKKAEYDVWLAQSLKHSDKQSQATATVTANKPMAAVSRVNQSNKAIAATKNSQTIAVSSPLRRISKLRFLSRGVLLALMLGVFASQSPLISGYWQHLISNSPSWKLIKNSVLHLVNSDAAVSPQETSTNKTVSKSPHKALADKAKIKATAYKKESQLKRENNNTTFEHSVSSKPNQTPGTVDKFADYYTAAQPECDIAMILMDEHVIRCK